ncbi:MAG TPA: F0F1 ATP synthase subunit A [Candidatus Dormibacteraeota bacterium]|nr:F0F1 ATP synthase subunit A [Candidatus Dormibacteraeota bacterium]
MGQSGTVAVSIQAETLFTIGPLEVTNSMVGAVLASAILLVAAWWYVRRARLVPSGAQSLIEFPIEWIGSIVRQSGGSRWRGFVGLATALFLLILGANWLSILPGVGTIGLVRQGADGTQEFVPFVRPASADLNFTLGLTLVSFVTFVAWGVRVNGVRGYLKELRGEPTWMAPLMMPIHIISDLSRLISLSMRLFGNVFAGDILLATMLALVPLFVPVIFMGLELIFGFIQALVFALLTMTYIILAIAEHAHSEERHTAEAQPVEAA